MFEPGASNGSIEIFVVNTPRAAAAALGAHRPGAESTHVLCRHEDESPPDFAARVLRRMARIRKSHGIRALWYVVGSESSAAWRSLPLLNALLEMLGAGSSLTVVGPGAHQISALDWLDSLMHRRHPEVTVGVRLYPPTGDAAQRFGGWQKKDAEGPALARSKPQPPRFRLPEPEPSYALADSA